MAIWTPNPKQVLARESADKLAAAISRSLPGDVRLDDLLKLNTEARKAGARHLLLVPPDGEPVPVSVNNVCQLRKCKGAFRRRGGARVTVGPEGVSVRWGEKGRLRLSCGIPLDYDERRRCVEVHIGQAAGKEAA
jgi:hypothetical protein